MEETNMRYENMFNCVKSDVLNIGEIPHSDGAVIWPDVMLLRNLK